jgi:hypothetical protein
VHAHGALFTTWVVLFVVQTALISSRRVAVHRRLGVAGAVLAGAMIVAGCLTAIATARRGGSVAGMDSLSFLAIPLFDMVLFAGFLTVALVRRRDKEAHKRLMLLAYISIVVAAVARLPGVIALGPPAFFGLALLFVVAGAIYDFVSRRRVHPVQYLFTGIAMVFFYVLLLSLAEHLGFIRAYLAASVATGAMLAIYAGAALSSVIRGLVMLVVFALTYAMLYLILQLEDYALLAGALLGFVALATVMFVTLRVDWSGAARGAAS